MKTLTNKENTPRKRGYYHYLWLAMAVVFFAFTALTMGTADGEHWQIMLCLFGAACGCMFLSFGPPRLYFLRGKKLLEGFEGREAKIEKLRLKRLDCILGLSFSGFLTLAFAAECVANPHVLFGLGAVVTSVLSIVLMMMYQSLTLRLDDLKSRKQQ